MAGDWVVFGVGYGERTGGWLRIAGSGCSLLLVRLVSQCAEINRP